MHRLDDDGHVEIQLAEPRHAHQLRHAVDLSGARAAFARFAVPSHSEIGRLLGLYAMDRIEDDHALVDLSFVVLKRSAVRIATPDSK